ncbi:XrtA/PEP-CTERM system TPR-repeat protein PrsT [Rheinheimera sp. UJ63]|uniref:XrtA/PEP-CTERM system TPR-repeat protein PrsT n=1 Tax=Rheinheimera sp. UJ63 TaxID=2910157 RepID=UPI0022A844DB|nr:XrtA/PEP-CTERM system TPR-repeat protein PrsT [Rheinheimera sp. UJ63]
MKKTCLSAAILLSLMLTGCGGKTPDEHFAAATELASQQRYNEAIISLKSAVAGAPENADYRVLLGRMYMQSGDFSSAEKEFGKAIENGLSINDMGLDLIQSFYRSENYQAVLNYFTEESGLSDSLQRYLSFYQASANIEMGTPENALTTFDQLVNAEEADLQTMAQAVLSIRNNEPQEALTLLESFNEESPIALEMLLMKAQLKSNLQQREAALEDFYAYLKQVPSSLRTRLIVAQVHLSLQQADKANEQLALILRFAPTHGLTNYLKAMIAYEKKDFTLAKEHIDTAITSRFNTASSRILAGLVNYELGLNSQALAHLTSVQDQLSIFPPAQRLFTALQLQAGEFTQAAKSLTSQTLTEDDLSLAASTAFQLMRSGEATLANDIIRKIEDAGLNKNSQALTQLGQLKLGFPDQTESAINDLEQALILDPSRHDARLILAASYIRQQQFDKASALGDEWLLQPETTNAGYNLKALAAMMTGKQNEAEQLLIKAEAADVENPFTIYLQAAVAQQNADSDKALELLNKTIKIKADYVPALTSIYRINKGLSQDVTPFITTLQETQKAYPENQELLLLVLNIYQQEGLHSATVQLLEDKVSKSENLGPSAYLALANAYAAQQQLPQALALTERWYKQDERDQQAALAYANVLSISGKFKDALQVTEKQLQNSPTDQRLLLAKFALLSELNNPKEALETYTKLSQEVANQPRVLLQKGRVELAAGQARLGLASLQKAYDKEPSVLTAQAMAETIAQTDSFDKAVKFLEKHFAEHGNDNQQLYSFYGSLLTEVDSNKAREVYESIAKAQPEDPAVLNNYAWVLATSGFAAEAQPYAEKALAILPQHPDIIDTYGKIMQLQGKYQEAADLFEKSLVIRPEHAEVQLNYVEALIKLNQKVKAAEVLNSVQPKTPSQTTRHNQLKSLI